MNTRPAIFGNSPFDAAHAVWAQVSRGAQDKRRNHVGKTVLILGSSGKVGARSAEAFAKAGWTVKRFDRKTGDLKRDAVGVDVIVNGWNPPAYHAWDRIIPEITRQVIAAAKASGATVIIPGNVYNLDSVGGTWSESTRHAPPTRKGQVRETMERAYEASGVQTIVLRAGNFIDPGRKDDAMSLLLLRSLQSGKLTSPGDPAALQAYCYVPDWAEAARQLAERRQTLRQFEDIPFPGYALSANELRDFYAKELSRPLKMALLPWWIFTMLAPFWELGREMAEMRYLYSLSHSLSAAKLTRLLPDFRPTPPEQALRAFLPGSERGTSGLVQPSH
jgi:nucleoside-diphosphate-sugar epimerase